MAATKKPPKQPEDKFQYTGDAKPTSDGIKNEEETANLQSSWRIKTKKEPEQTWSAELTRLASLLQGTGAVEKEMESYSLEVKEKERLMKKLSLVLKFGVFQPKRLSRALELLESKAKSIKGPDATKRLVEPLEKAIRARQVLLMRNLVEKTLSRVREETEASLCRLNSVKKMVGDVKNTIRNLESIIAEMQPNLVEYAGVKNNANAIIDEIEWNLQELTKIVSDLERKCGEEIDREKRWIEKKAAISISTVRLKGKSCEVFNDHEVDLKKLQSVTKSQMEKAKAKLYSVLSMLKSFSSNDGAISEEENVGEELKPYVAEFEAIKNVLKSREAKVEDMKKKVECLEQFAKSQKLKSFYWNTASLVTTSLAAVFVACVCYKAIRRQKLGKGNRDFGTSFLYF